MRHETFGADTKATAIPTGPLAATLLSGPGGADPAKIGKTTRVADDPRTKSYSEG